MPIYEYACPDCGHADEHMQKLADVPIAVCPTCGSSKYYKKISAAGFALKGTGWYVTDFKGGGGTTKPAEKKAGESSTAAASSSSSSSSESASAPAAAPAPAPASTSSSE